jgi:DNA-packaging protein gp3
MAAPEGNNFWELRSKHGRDPLFATPDLMWEAATEYFAWCVENPLIEVDFVGKDATEVKIPHMRPFTMEGLCLYLDCNTEYFRQFKKRLNPTENPLHEDFARVIKRIEENIYLQKFEGAAAGFLNANLISRDLGLKDNIVKELNVKKKTTLTLKLNGGDRGNSLPPAGGNQSLPQAKGDS